MTDVLFEVVLPVLLVALAGGIVGKRLDFSTETFSRAVFYLFSPCLVFNSIAEIEVSGGDVGRLVAVAVGVFVVNALFALLWSLVAHTDRPTRACAVLSACVVNQGNMGLPMAKLAFGDEGLRIAVVIFVAGVVLWSSAGIAFGSWARGSHSGWRAMLAPFRYPSIYAALAGAAINVANIDLPDPPAGVHHHARRSVDPCMLVVLGLQFRRPRLDDIAEPLATAPTGCWSVRSPPGRLPPRLGLSGTSARTSIMMAGMPTAVMTTILTTRTRRAT